MDDNIKKYAAVMREIKLRTEVIEHFLLGGKDAVYVPTTIETIGLQFRKVFESIAFASLAANQREYSSAYADFSEHWQAAKLLRNLKSINPKFYPKPVVEMPSDIPGVDRHLNDRDQDYLTKSDLSEAHGRCGALMHAANPFGKPIDYAFFRVNFPVWRTKYVNLLNNHQVHLVGDSGFYQFHMRHDGSEEVFWYRFKLGQPPTEISKLPRNTNRR